MKPITDRDQHHGNGVLLTGSNGFLGREISKVLSDLRVPTFMLGGTTKVRSLRNDCWFGDIADVDFLNSLDFSFDTIVHSAASWSEGSNFYRNNVLATENLVEFALKRGCQRFILLSSTSVFGCDLEEVGSPAIRDRAVMSYGASKAMAERAVLEKARNPLVVRLPGVVGPGAHSGILPGMVKSAVQNREIAVYNSDALFNSIVSVENVGQFICSLLAVEFPSDRDTIVLGSSKPVTIRQLAELVLNATAPSGSITSAGSGPQPTLIDYSRAKGAYGYQPETVKEVAGRFLHYAITSASRSQKFR